MSAEVLNLLLLVNDVDPEVIHEISRKTNMITSVILIIVAAVFLILVVYLVYLHIITKKPKRSTERYNNYRTATAKITDIEMVSYFVKPYERTPEKQENVPEYFKNMNTPTVFGKDTNIPSVVRNNPVYREAQMEKLEINRMIEKNEFRKSIGEPENKKDEIEKIRFKVRYEFSTDSSNLYSGECFVYERNDNIEVGKTIEIKYNPINPMMNFSVYSAPVGTQ